MNRARNDIGQRLREIREQLGLTQTEMGEKLNRGKAAVSKYENGDSEPTYAVLNQYAEMSGRSYNWIFTGQETEEGQGIVGGESGVSGEAASEASELRKRFAGSKRVIATALEEMSEEEAEELLQDYIRRIRGLRQK